MRKNLKNPTIFNKIPILEFQKRENFSLYIMLMFLGYVYY